MGCVKDVPHLPNRNHLPIFLSLSTSGGRDLPCIVSDDKVSSVYVERNN